MRKRLDVLLAAALALTALCVPATAMAAQVYPDLRTLPPRDLRFATADVGTGDTGDTGVHNVLRFTNTVWNAGESKLAMRGDLDPTTKRGPAYQRIFEDTGNFLEVDTGSDMYFHPSHSHYHFDDWGTFQLWSAAEYDAWVAGGSGQAAEETGTKTTSCILDEEFIRKLAGAPWPQGFLFSGCNPNSQGDLLEGISVGWGDTYDYWRADQWIDLGPAGTLADGEYVLRSVVDPDNFIYESPNRADAAREGRTSNDAALRFRVSGGRLVDGTAPTGTVTVNNVDRATDTPNVTVKALGRDDVAGVDQFRVSNDGNTWATYNYTGEDSTPASIPWDLTDARYGGTAATGNKTVRVQFHDRSGKWGPTETDTIELRGASPLSAYARTVLADGPVSFWRVGEASGTTAADERAANPGSYINAPTLSQPSLLASDGAGRSVALDGTNDSVRVNDSASLDFGAALTLEAWIKPAAVPATGQWASVMTKTEAYTLQFNGPRLEFTVVQGTARRRAQAPAGAIQANQAYHVVGTYDGTTQRLYVNGAQVASQPLTGSANVNTSRLHLGTWDGGSELFRGAIDEPAVYSRALTAAQVKAHYDEGAGTPTAQPPAAPSSLAATAASDTRVDLSWVDNATDESSYVLERSTDSAFSAPVRINVANDEESHADTGLSPSTQYWYRVRARNAVGSSGWSNVATATTKPVPPPPAPAAPSNLAGSAPSQTAIDLTWADNSADESGFVLERSTSSSFTSPTRIDLAAGTTSHSDSNLAPATQYWYRVSARNAGGSSAWSNAISVTTQAPAPTSPAAPSGLAAGAASSSRIDVRWTDNATDETSYVLERSATSAFTTVQSVPLAADATTYADSGLAAGTTFWYRVKAVNAAGSSAWSNSASATTQPEPAGYAASVTADGPVSWWRLGETSGTTAADQRAANPGTYNGTPGLGAAGLIATDTANRAVAFDGSNDHVRVPDANSLDLTSAITMEAWIKPGLLPAAGTFRSIATKAESYSLQFNGPLLEFTIMQNGARQRLQAPAGTIVAGQTYHVVGTFDGATRRLYVNGAQVASAALGGAASVTPSALHIGTWNGFGEWFGGTIDEVAVYNRALSAASVAGHHSAGRGSTAAARISAKRSAQPRRAAGRKRCARGRRASAKARSKCRRAQGRGNRRGTRRATRR